MKKLTFVLLLVNATLSVFSQSPAFFQYQAVIREKQGSVMVIKQNSNVSVDISILQGSPSGTSIFTETHDTTTNEFGLVTLKIGSNNPAAFSTIDWSTGPYFLQIEVDDLLMGVTQLLSVPYAKYADKAGYVTNESDPVYSTSVAASITADDTTRWATSSTFSGQFNDLLNIPAGLSDGDDNTQLNEAEVDTYVSNNGYLTTEVDGSISNELQLLSISKDTLFLSNGNYVLLPDTFSGSFNDLTDVPANLDIDNTDDFDGNYNSLSNLPNWSDSINTEINNQGLGTISLQDSNAVNIDGGTIDGTAIGSNSASTGSFTTLSASGSTSLGSTVTITGATGIDNAVTINESGADTDTRIEGNTDANLVTVDASEDKIGIGVAAPSSKLDINGDMEVASDGFVYFGDPSTDGTWRIGRSGDDLVFQRRESSAWITKITMQD